MKKNTELMWVEKIVAFNFERGAVAPPGGVQPLRMVVMVQVLGPF